MHIGSWATDILISEARKYIHFEVEGKRVSIPYILGYGRWRFWQTGGKGSVEAIRNELKRLAQRKRFNLKAANPFAIYDLIRQNKLGIDCSGFVYQVLDPWVRVVTQKSLGQILLRYPGVWGKLERRLLGFQRQRRVDAQTLVSGLNTQAVERVDEVQPGDLIKFRGEQKQRSHIAVVVQVERQGDKVTKISYAHSSRNTQEPGPHLAEIRVMDPRQDLSQQEWLERTRDGQNYGAVAYQGHGEVRRLLVISKS